MSNKMLIDATHPEETRVVVLRGNRVEEFDFEAADRQLLRGNIYLAKVTRVEPSLQAAFVDYGGNRHGFLAFSEIHPDYYQIPFADRQALLQEQARDDAEEAAADAHHDDVSAAEEAGGHGPVDNAGEPIEQHPDEQPHAHDPHSRIDDASDDADVDAQSNGSSVAAAMAEPQSIRGEAFGEDDSGSEAPADANGEDHEDVPDARGGNVSETVRDHEDDKVESVGAEDALEELPERRKPRPRQYKIQEVIKRRQVLLVQVVKEERGNKGAALTTYLSLAGRYSVLMPNTARGGGISRKITTPLDRKRLKSIAQELEVPEGMGVILRTAGANRTKGEIKRDFEYLLRLWENVRELTLRSSAPKLVYEEGNLIKRSIRDLYSKEIEQIMVAGADAYREAKDFMRMLMPSHAKNVQAYTDTVPVFARNGVEAQLDAMFSPQVTLKSGGYIVINQTEALVSIDVNSGRSTREHSIEDTALKTNLEAAEEVSRQLRLRDLAGLIVIDFIDMEEKRNNRSVERKLKDCLRADRARIQVGRISHFGLMEMSRQRIRTGVLESSTVPCPHCRGTGQVRSISSLSLQILRALEDQLLRNNGNNLHVRTRPEVALYVLNQKRRHLADLEMRFGVMISVLGEAPDNGAGFAVERGSAVEHRIEPNGAIAMRDMPPPAYDEEEDEAFVEDPVEAEDDVEIEATGGDVADEDSEAGGSGERERRPRRRRRRRGNGDGRHEHRHHHEDDAPRDDEALAARGVAEANDETGDMPPAPREAGNGRSEGADEEGRDARRRRRGRRGGRRRARGRNGEAEAGEFAADGQRAEGAGPGAFADDEEGVEAVPHAFDDDTADDRVLDTPIEQAEPIAHRDAGYEDESRYRVEETRYRPAEPEPAAAPYSPEPVTVAEPAAPPPAPQPEPDDGRPKRTGWWSRKSSFF